jgi:hypothetical protein
VNTWGYTPDPRILLTGIWHRWNATTTTAGYSPDPRILLTGTTSATTSTTYRWADPSAWGVGARRVYSMADLDPRAERVWADWALVRSRDDAAIRAGLVWDWDSGEWLEPAVYEARQRERQAAADRARERHQAAALARRAERDAAEARAEHLLALLLTPEQQAEWATHGRFHVTAPSGRVYQLSRGWAGNVAEVDPHTRRRLTRFCIHPRQSLPLADNVAAQLLLLRTDEGRFLATANPGA